jgi:hypothetical protein
LDVSYISNEALLSCDASMEGTKAKHRRQRQDVVTPMLVAAMDLFLLAQEDFVIWPMPLTLMNWATDGVHAAS